MKHILRKTLSLLLVFTMTTGIAQPALAGTLILPSRLSAIEESAFEGDWSLDQVALPEGVETIGERAFADSSLAGINLPDSLTRIAPDAFDETSNVDFDVHEGTYAYDWLRRKLNPTVEATVLDCYTVTWWDTLAPEGTEYTVSAWMDEACTELYMTRTTLEDGMDFNTDVGTRYWFTVEYTDARGVTFRSDPGTADPIPPLEAPKNLTLTLQEDGTVVPGWDAVPGAEGYRMYYSRTEQIWSRELDQFAFEGGPENVDISLLRLEEEETLFFWVCADNGDGPNLRAFSQITRPEAPLIQCTAETIYTDVYLISWEPLDGASDYTVLTYTDESCEHLYLSSPAEEYGIFLHTDVGTQYWFVLQYTRKGKILRSEPVTSEPMEILPAPENFTAEVDEEGEIHLAWTPVPDATGYRLYTSTETNVWSPDLAWTAFEGPIETGTFGELRIEEGGTMFLWLCADNGMGPNAMSFAMVQRGDGSVLQAAVQSASTDCYELSWTMVSGIADYTVRVYEDPSCEMLYRSVDAAGNQTAVNTDVGTYYWFTVECVRDGETIRSEPVSAEPMEVLPAPGNLRADTEENGTVLLSWDPVDGAEGYRICFSEDPDWTPETEWISRGGETENSELQIGGNETLYLWVCAENGNGPHERAETLALRYDDLYAMIQEKDITLSSLLLDVEPYPILSTEGISDAEELEWLNGYNSLAADFNERVEAYNALVRETIETVENYLGYVSGSAEEGFLIGGCQVSVEALEILSGEYKVTDSRMEEEVLIVSLRSAEGGTARLRITDTEISTDSGRRSAGLIAKARPNINWTDHVGAAGSLVGTGMNRLIDGGKTDLDIVKNSNDYLRRKVAQGDPDKWVHERDQDLLKSGKVRQAEIESGIKRLGYVSAAANGLGLGDDIMSSVSDVHSMMQLQSAMLEHGHPTELERLHEESLELTRQLTASYSEARRWLSADLAVNGISLALSFVKFHPVGAIAVTVATYGANQWLNAQVDKVCEEMTRIDGMLHYEVTGTVRDKDTGKVLEDVEVTCEMPPYSPMTVRTDANGIYRLEPLTESFTLSFTKEKYEDLSIPIPEAGRKVERDVPYPYHAEMVPDAWGTVTGVILDEETNGRIEGVTVSCGEYSTVSDASGCFEIQLPPENLTLHYDREGYISKDLDIAVLEDRTVDGSIKMSSCYVIRTREDLENVRNLPDARYCLGNNINLSGRAWTPECWFSGELDGRGFAIQGMTVEAGNGGNTGLFAGLTGGAVIKNLRISGASVSVQADEAFMNTGILCGNMLGGASVQDSTFDGTVQVSDGTANGQVFAGGVSGLVQQGIIVRCQVNANITVTFRNQIHAGGIFGQMNSGTVEHCSYSGTLSGNQSGNSSAVQVYVAGIGYSSGVYSNDCHVNGQLYANATNGAAIAVGLLTARHGTNRAGVHASSDGGKAYAAGGQDGYYLENHGSVSASSLEKNADAAGLNSVSFSTNYGSVTASSYNGDTTAIGVVNNAGGCANYGSVLASSYNGNHFEADYN